MRSALASRVTSDAIVEATRASKKRARDESKEAIKMMRMTRKNVVRVFEWCIAEQLVS